ncbi:MAG: rhodanese-like domain-containing protein [Xanthomonadales bacterium]|jgi:phage shock protein E|nr:rhodanese-like domain-containing protein [Xanthomonadales bacterium]
MSIFRQHPASKGSRKPLAGAPVFRFLGRSSILVALLWLGSAVQAQDGLRGDPEAAAEAWRLIEDGALVIDVRSAEEYAAGALEGAMHVPHDDTEALKQAIGEERSRPVVMYCGSGRRVGIAIDTLEADGYDGLHNATGLDALEATQP